MSSTPIWNRFVRFISTDDRELCGEPEDANVDVGLAVASGKHVKVKVLGVSSALENGQWTGEVASIKKLLSPVTRAEAGTIRCIGLNFKDHAAELKCAIPKVPEVFFKPAQCLHSPSDPVAIPPSAADALDSEVELAVVIGRDCKNVDVKSAPSYVLGYTAANDMTARDVQSRTSQWGYSKGYDGFCPLGPVIVRAGRPGMDVARLTMRTVLDGDVLQDGNSSEMIFSIAEIVSHLSKDTTLPAGTVILTGTPSGIGHSYSPPKYLRPGCHLRVEIGSGIGTLTNTFVEEPTGSKL